MHRNAIARARDLRTRGPARRSPSDDHAVEIRQDLSGKVLAGPRDHEGYGEFSRLRVSVPERVHDIGHDLERDRVAALQEMSEKKRDGVRIAPCAHDVGLY